MKRLSLPLLIATLCAMIGTPAQAAEPAVSLTAAGSGVNLGITRELAKAFMTAKPGVEIKVPGSIGTKGAITAIADNAITFGLISRPLKESESNPEITVFAYAKTPVVIAANQSVKDDAITNDDLLAIYSGTKTKWSDGSDIIVQTREAFDSGFMILSDKIPGFQKVHEESNKAQKWMVYYTDQDANRALSETRSAIGVTDMGMIATENLHVKALKLNDVQPSNDTLSNGTYPLARTLYMIYREKTLPPEGKAFVDFVRSDKGAAILKKYGYITVAAKP